MSRTEEIVNWIKDYFKRTGFSKAVIGISGGKDSTICAALLAEALGIDNVYGVSMPFANNKELDKPTKEVVDAGIIKNIVILPIGRLIQLMEADLCNLGVVPTEQATINVQPRQRMVRLMHYGQSLGGALACCTSNLCERLVGYYTRGGDNFGDIAPLANLLVSEVHAIGDELKIPHELVYRTPEDGLSGMTDEEKLGVTYNDIESCFNKFAMKGDSVDEVFPRIHIRAAQILGGEYQDRFTAEDRKVLRLFQASYFKYLESNPNAPCGVRA